MDYDDRIRRTRQASLVSSACAATPERMAMRPLCASICRATGQDAGTSGIADNLLVLNFANNSEILQRGGVHAGIHSKLFNFQEVIGRNFSSCVHSLLKNHTRHTVSPPCGNALAETFIYPGTVPRTSMLCPQVSGAFCIQQQTDKPNMNI